MPALCEYAAAILRRESPMEIVRHHSEMAGWRDQGISVRRCATTYEFADGVVIRRTVEQDEQDKQDEHLGETLCPECWITYEVLSDGTAATPVAPRHRTFDNACREAFWLKYHSA